MSSQSRGASLSKKIISIQRNNNYKKCGLYSVASPPLSSSRLLIYKGVLCDKIWVFFLSFSRSPSKQQTTTESANKYISQALKARNLEKEKREQVNSFTLRFKSSFQEKQVYPSGSIFYLIG